VEAVKQYEIWWVELPGPAGRRPVLLLSRDDAYDALNKFIAAEITTTIRNIPVEVHLTPTEGITCVLFPKCTSYRKLRSFPRGAYPISNEPSDTRWDGRN
jgi:mRNA-degrading endonuclease toxin of MazEF toxin-antitoxin module